MIREAEYEDLEKLLELYRHLHEEKRLQMDERVDNIWKQIMDDPCHHVIVAEEDGEPVSSCVCVVIPNLTREARPYAFVENVVTHERYRGRGLATDCLNRACEIAREAGCYKMMLLTGSKEESTLAFYRKAGYNSEDKTAFIQWL